MANVIKKELRDKIVAQGLNELSFARRYKQGKVANWKLNEDLYYGNKRKTDEARANVDLGQMQEFVHTLLSKIDNPLTFKFEKRKESQVKRVARLNALKDYDSERDNWDIKDIAGKKQMAIYGRAVYSYAAQSYDMYKPQLENVDVYDFLIDPSTGGIDIDRGRFMGRYGVVKDRYDLKGNSNYIQTEVKELLMGKGNNLERPQEELNKQNRVYANKHDAPQKETDSDDKFVFWEWYTTYEGKRYYMLLSETGARAIKVCPLTELFASDMWPFWTYAAYPDLTEFWTPSPCDYVRELVMAQNVSINQMLDNAERVNKPQRIVDVSAIKNLAELKYKRDGYIKVTPGTAGTAVKIVETPSIETPLKVFEQLEGIKRAATGITEGALGVADTDGRATIYEGNQASVADRFGLFNKSYSFGYKRFGVLYMHGVDENLTKKVAVDIIGPEGIEQEKIGRTDIFRKGDDFGVMVEASNAELALSDQKKRTLSAFYASLLGRADMANQKVVIEQLARVAGAEPELIRQLLDIDLYGNAEIMSEAERDIEDLLDGKVVKPNRKANAAYKQRFVDYMQDHEDDMDEEAFSRMVSYVMSLDEIIMANTIRAAQEQAQREMTAQMGATGGGTAAPKMRAPGPAQPLQDVIQQNVQN
jgi:hypothetical protein